MYTNYNNVSTWPSDRKFCCDQANGIYGLSMSDGEGSILLNTYRHLSSKIKERQVSSANKQNCSIDICNYICCETTPLPRPVISSACNKSNFQYKNTLRLDIYLLNRCLMNVCMHTQKNVHFQLTLKRPRYKAVVSSTIESSVVWPVLQIGSVCCFRINNYWRHVTLGKTFRAFRIAIVNRNRQPNIWRFTEKF